MENFSTSKMYKQFLFFPIALILLSGCDLINPIRQLDCKTTKSFLFSGNKLQPYKFHPADPKQDPLFILNIKSGNFYETDDFTGKIESINGKTELEGDTYYTKTNISNDIWKLEMITIHSPRNPQNDLKMTTKVDFKTMKYERKEFFKSNGIWNPLTVSEGICKWGKPKTTELLKKE